jgi:glutathione S-transferase
MNVTDYPGLYQDAEAASSRAKKHYVYAVLATVTLLMISAVISLVEFAPVWSSFLQAGALLGSLAITIYLAKQQPQKRWYATRALAEDIKSRTWCWMMRAAPYHEDEAAARTRFLSDLGDLVETDSLGGHLLALSGQDQISSFMAEVRKQGINERKRLYGLDRIEDQLKWYRSKVHSNSRLAKRWLIALIGFQFMAITFALARLGFPTGPNWPVGVFSAAAVAAMAWIQAKQFRERAASYSLSFHEASLVRGRLENLASEQELCAFVLDVERILSRERHRTLG